MERTIIDLVLRRNDDALYVDAFKPDGQYMFTCHVDNLGLTSQDQKRLQSGDIDAVLMTFRQGEQ